MVIQIMVADRGEGSIVSSKFQTEHFHFHQNVQGSVTAPALTELKNAEAAGQWLQSDLRGQETLFLDHVSS